MSALQKELFRKSKHQNLDLESAETPLSSNDTKVEEQREEEDCDTLAELNGGLSSPSRASMPDRMKNKYAPVSWNTYFESYQDVTIPDTSDISFFFLFCNNLALGLSS
ncbi:hypothetical protein BDB00DRAFT_262800 [Zychaea mexicana]|uniref:uncharacterized protein n=1 Tax=Zychaea mexicana TaxID=64656 RepID=UPI0022FDF79A|nr:uncharacterized protein BDB00DRAFT_262800 [Zychaea mexicana]KAI9469346.1 hypothetical protein BDB00DRAFT_262800 [Zychaea mexicana]